MEMFEILVLIFAVIGVFAFVVAVLFIARAVAIVKSEEGESQDGINN